VRWTPWAVYACPVGVMSAATAIRKLLHERGHGHVGHIVAFNLVTKKGKFRIRNGRVRSEVDALGVIRISRGCFERC